MTPEERTLLNEETLHGEGPIRLVGAVELAAVSFRRRRLLGRIFHWMQSGGATEAELLYGYIAVLGTAEADLRAATSSAAAWDDALDNFFEARFAGHPSTEELFAARRLFDYDMNAIAAASVDVQARPGATDKAAPPNS